MKTDKTALAALTLALVCTGAVAEPSRFVIHPGEPNLVKFTSQAPLETIVGTTNGISGELNLNPANLSEPVTASFTVQMATLDTDNRIRNGHMRNNHLHTDRFPTSGFVLHAVNLPGGGGLPPDTPLSFTITGDFTCHGVTRNVQPAVTALWRPDAGALDVTARFDVKLSDYDIPRPQFLVMKLDEVQKVEVTFTAVKE